MRLLRLISRTAPYVGAALLAFFICLIVGVYAYANQVTITYSGTITSANDLSGYFGNVTTAMNGKAFTLAFTMDDTQGAQYLGTWPTCNNGLQNSGTSNPVPKPVLSITSGTRPYTFGGLAWNSYSSFTSSSNGTSPKTKLFNKLAPVFTGGTAGLSGSESSSAELDLQNTNTCRAWYNSWLYSLTTGDTVAASITSDFANSDQGVNINDFAVSRRPLISDNISASARVPSVFDSDHWVPLASLLSTG